MNTKTATSTAARIGAQAAGEAEIYQRLRGHLDYLKLADATGALPRILDDARAAPHSVTATIEALLRVEVDAVEARRAGARMRSSCLPAPWTIADFDFAKLPGRLSTVHASQPG